MQAKHEIASKNFGLFDDEFDLKKQHDYFEGEMAKTKYLNGNFKKAFFYDNGATVDDFGRTV